MSISRDEQIRCVKREIALRERTYPRLIHARRMSQLLADKELATMKAVLHTLLALPAEQAEIPAGDH